MTSTVNRGELARRFDRHVLACSAMAGTAVLGLAPAPANADIISVTGLSVPVPSGMSVSFDFDGGGITDLVLGSYLTGSPYLTYLSGPYSTGTLVLPVYSYFGDFYVDNVAATTSIDLSGTFSSVGYVYPVSYGNVLYDSFYPYGEFAVGVGGPVPGTATGNYIGFYFYSEVYSSFNFGWISLDLAGFTPTITGFGFESFALTAIAAGAVAAVPEPASMGLASLALGAAGLASWRRRRLERETPEA